MKEIINQLRKIQRSLKGIKVVSRIKASDMEYVVIKKEDFVLLKAIAEG